jgi:hypothetical protein
MPQQTESTLVQSRKQTHFPIFAIHVFFIFFINKYTSKSKRKGGCRDIKMSKKKAEINRYLFHFLPLA